MFRHELLIQSPGNPGVAIAGVEAVASGARFDRLRGAFAYASVPGTQEFIDALTVGAGSDWRPMQKRWLISADFGFTEPGALELLLALPGSEVRIPDAPYLLRQGLRPRVTHHAKGLVLDRRGTPEGHAPLALFVGSANLTASALYDNFEYVVTSIWTGAQRGAAQQQLLQVEAECSAVRRGVARRRAGRREPSRPILPSPRAGTSTSSLAKPRTHARCAKHLKATGCPPRACRRPTGRLAFLDRRRKHVRESEWRPKEPTRHASG